ncbi:hypothetical protein WKY82_10380 [Gordonia malaquae]|uniref:hypothetical protein n=1 Tax=Gordonia malaquae TaxID=410332 RepID=UPI0030C785FB
MAKMKAFPTGSTESIEWELSEQTNVEQTAAKLVNARDARVTIPTSSGWVRVDLGAYAAIEIVE